MSKRLASYPVLPILDHGADINATTPADRSDSGGYSLLLCRTKEGPDYSEAYADALHLLERGADPNRGAPDGMTFAKILTEQKAHFTRTPPEFTALWDWAAKHGIVQ